MTKGKTWSVEEEKQLREMVQAHRRLNEVAGVFGKSPESIKKKISRLRLVVVVRQIQQTTTSNELPSDEEALKDLVEAKTPLSVIAKKLMFLDKYCNRQCKEKKQADPKFARG